MVNHLTQKSKVVEMPSSSHRSTIVFTVTAKKEGINLIEIDFFQDSRYVGGTQIKVEAH